MLRLANVRKSYVYAFLMDLSLTAPIWVSALLLWSRAEGEEARDGLTSARQRG